jgi:hypothetical protein
MKQDHPGSSKGKGYGQDASCPYPFPFEDPFGRFRIAGALASGLMIFPNFMLSKKQKAEILYRHNPLCLPGAPVPGQLRMAQRPHFHGKGCGRV